MINAYQTCRVCGVRVPSGFTNCDACYHQLDNVKETENKYLTRPFPVPAKLMPILIHKPVERSK